MEKDKLAEVQNAREWVDALLTAAVNERASLSPDTEDTIPVLPHLQTYQHPDIVVNDDGQAMMVYDKPLPDVVWWAEYDPDLAELSFVTIGKKIFGYGAKIHPKVDRFLRQADMIFLVQVDDEGNIVSAEDRKLVVRRNGRA